MKKLPKINTSKLLKAALPYILVGLMATKLGQAYRMASGGDVLDRIFGAFLKIGEAFTNPLPSLHPFDLLVGAACGALLWFIVYQKSKNARKYRRGAEYGTARWGNAKDIEPFIDPDFSQNILLSETERLTLGKIADPEKRNVNLNVLVIGGSGSGKTRYHIKPNLLQMNASYVCSDPKGTVIEEVGRALVRGGYKIKVLNTIDFSCSMHYNPFVYLHSETDILTLVTVTAPPAGEPAACICTVLCQEGAVNPDCAVCQSDRAQCIGKAPDTSTEPEQPTEPDTPTEPEQPAEPEKCTCTDKCAAGAVNTGCEICKNDLTKCEGKEPEVVDPKFTISILAPDGWYTNRANVEIRIKDVNKTGWDTVEAKINSGGSWIDLTDDLVDKDKVSLEISENCTIYVTVTDKNGKSHTKNRYIEVFDREAPTIRAGIEGELLRVEASDDLSGVDKIYVCGNSFSKLNNGTLDIRLKDYADNYEQITIQATDRAGNKSRMTQLNNPYYEEPKKDSDKTSSSPTSPSIPASTVTTPTGGGTGTTLSQSGTGGTASTGQTAKPTGGTISSSNKADTEKDPSAVSPVATEETEDNPFTPDGSATVVDNASDEQGKEFYTIMTPDENVFYLIIDKQRDSENVYFLNAVTESDLMALAQKDTDSQTVTPTAPSEPEPAAPAEPEEPSEPETPEPEPEQPAPKSSNSMIFLVIVIALAAGGLGYYFKVYKPKHDLDDAEDIDDFEFEGPEEPAVNEDEEATGEDAGQEELSEEEEAEQRRLYEEDNEDIPIEGDDDLVF